MAENLIYVHYKHPITVWNKQHKNTENRKKQERGNREKTGQPRETFYKNCINYRFDVDSGEEECPDSASEDEKGDNLIQEACR